MAASARSGSNAAATATAAAAAAQEAAAEKDRELSKVRRKVSALQAEIILHKEAKDQVRGVGGRANLYAYTGKSHCHVE